MDGITIPAALDLDALACRPLWVAWRVIDRNGKPTKEPLNPSTGRPAKANDPATWAPRDEAEAAARRYVQDGAGGVGIELADLGDGFQLGGIDLDTCRDPETGRIETWARDVIDLIPTYAEISPSKTGTKLYFRYHADDLPELRKAMGTDYGKLWQRGGGEHPPAIELHLGRRYFAVTDDHLAGTPKTIEAIPTETLLRLIREVGPRFKGAKMAAAPHGKPAQALPAAGDILDRLNRAAASTPRLSRALARLDQCGSRSEAAMALGSALKAAGWSYEDMTEALRAHPATAAWTAEKGDEAGGRELRRIYQKATVSDGQTEITRDAGGWPETSIAPIPLPDGLPPVAPFTDDLLPDAFLAWVLDIANRMQCPPDFPAVAAIVTASAVIGRQMGIYPKRRDDWLVVPNLWGAVVGRPSLMKTPAIAEARKILARLEIEARKQYEREVAEYELNGSIAKLVTKERTKSAARSIKKAMEAGDDPEKAARAAMGADDEDIKPPVRRRYVTQDPTVEKLGELLIETPRGMLLFRDELIGLLRSMDKDGHENDRAFYLEAWNGNGAYTYDRIGRGTIEIDAACVSLMGGIQPGPLRAYIAQANAGGAGDDGLLQRMQLLVWPDRGDEWRNVDEWPDTTAKTRAYSVFERLDQIGDPTSTEIPAIRFDDAGQDAFNAWREVFERRFYAEDMPPALEAHLTKYRSLVPSLALIFHLIDTPDAPAVGARHVSRAIRWTEYLESHARRLYSQILDPGMVAALLLAGRLPELPETFTARDVYRRGWAGLDRAATDRALEVLADFHHVAVKTETTGGRPSAIYRKNFHETPKQRTDKTDKRGLRGAFVSFGSDPNEGWSENFSDEVVL